ncbi:MAG: transglycosylase SLT domain-containing protein, partial [Gammaproteobacteria bacterium]|nr:transglycosylase SLT domain-containing protein [Gammaproteobacteria bacterium]
MTSSKSFLLLVFLVFSAGSIADDTFPQPPDLQADVDFWVDVFTRYGNDEGILHDNRNLAVVYDRLPIPEKTASRERQRRVEKRRKELQAVLRSLATGKRDRLTAEEARVLALWPAGVSNETLAAAVGQIRYQQGLKDRFREGLRRSGRWRDHVNREFSALNLPIEIAALPHVESSYNPDARSNVGASGIWQFTRSTGQRFMRIDHVVDERNDPFLATRAAAQLMAYNYSLTGNWPMAITAYNHGLGGVRRAMSQYGDTAYVDILRKYNGRTFGFASRNFYVAFLAAKEVDQNVEKYFPGLQAEPPTRYSVASLPGYISVSGLAAALGTTPLKLRQHNPALQATVWQESKYLPKGYELRFPADSLQRPLSEVLANLPPSAVFAKQLPDMFHKVVRGDTLSQIAATYGTRVSTLIALNNLNSRGMIRAGQQLRLPAAGPAPVIASVAAAPPADEIPETPPVAEIPASAAVPDLEVVEMLPGAMAGDAVAAVPGPAQTSLLSDPSDYSVAGDDTIEVQPMETLGHYGDWLEIKTQRLRDLNRLAFGTPV